MPSSSSYWALAWRQVICKTKQGEDHEESSQTAEPHSGATLAGGQRQEPGCHLHKQHQHLHRTRRLPPTQLNNYPPPSWSLALTEMYPITMTTAPCQPGWRWEILHYCSSPPFSPFTHQSVAPPSPPMLDNQFVSPQLVLGILGALCNGGWQSQWAQSQTCPIVSIRPTAHDHHSTSQKETPRWHHSQIWYSHLPLLYHSPSPPPPPSHPCSSLIICPTLTQNLWQSGPPPSPRPCQTRPAVRALHSGTTGWMWTAKQQQQRERRNVRM